MTDESQAGGGDRDEAEPASNEAVSAVATEPQASPRAAPRCTICGTLVRDAEPVKSCPACLQAYHATCWDEIGGCATYGCTEVAAAEKPPPPVVTHLGWGDEKECPECEGSIASSLLVCRCGARFPWADPMTPDEYHAWVARERLVERTRKNLVALLALSLAGFAAPISGPLAAYIAHKNRRLLAGAHGVYLAMGYGSAALGAAYVGVALILAFAQ